MLHNVRPALRRAGIVAQKFKIVQMLNRITKVDYSTSASLLQNWLLCAVFLWCSQISKL